MTSDELDELDRVEYGDISWDGLELHLIHNLLFWWTGKAG